MEKKWKREYVRRKHEKEYVCRNCGREGMLGVNIKTFERVCKEEAWKRMYVLEKTWERGCVWRKHWREGMFGENICIGERVGKEKRRGLMEIT